MGVVTYLGGDYGVWEKGGWTIIYYFFWKISQQLSGYNGLKLSR